MTRRFHLALSVDVDRFGDAKIRRDYLGCLVDPETREPAYATVAEFRAACREHRAKGFEVFPPCDHHDAKGLCLGHPEETPA